MSKLYFVRTTTGVVAQWSNEEIPNNVGVVDITPAEWDNLLVYESTGDVDHGVSGGNAVDVRPPANQKTMEAICREMGVPQECINETNLWNELDEEDSYYWCVPLTAQKTAELEKHGYIKEHVMVNGTIHTIMCERY